MGRKFSASVPDGKAGGKVDRQESEGPISVPSRGRSGRLRVEQVPVRIGVAGQDPKQNDSVRPHVNDLGNSRVSVVVTDNDEGSRLELDTGRGVRNARRA